MHSSALEESHDHTARARRSRAEAFFASAAKALELAAEDLDREGYATAAGLARGEAQRVATMVKHLPSTFGTAPGARGRR